MLYCYIAWAFSRRFITVTPLFSGDLFYQIYLTDQPQQQQHSRRHRGSSRTCWRQSPTCFVGPHNCYATQACSSGLNMGPFPTTVDVDKLTSGKEPRVGMRLQVSPPPAEEGLAASLTEAFDAISANLPDFTEHAPILKGCRGIALMEFDKVSALVGVEKGRGFVMSRVDPIHMGPDTSHLRWSLPVALESKSLGIGIQAGVTRRHCFLFILTEAALVGFISGRTQLGTNLDFALGGGHGMGLESLPASAGVYIFTLEKAGVEMGLSLKGMHLGPDLAATAAFYGLGAQASSG
eukprot:jgi/Mesvir1/11211/Mv03061-RA.2